VHGVPRGRSRVRAVRLRSDDDHRARLLDVDFSAPRERLVREALCARLDDRTLDELASMTLADRHWLVAQLLRRDRWSTIAIAAKCDGCAELLELSFDLIAAIEHAEPAIRRGSRDPSVRLPTSADVERAETPADLLRLCAPHFTGGSDAAEHLLSEADPLA